MKQPSDLSAVRIFFYGVLMILVAEVLVFIFIDRFELKLSHLNVEIIESVIRSGMILPLLYFVLYRPAKRTIEALRAASEKLTALQYQYRSLVESTEDSIYLVDRDYRYVFVNRKHLSRLGMRKEDLIGRPYEHFHSAVETAEFVKIVNGVFETGESVQQEHVSQRDGLPFLRTLSPVRDADQKIVSVTVISKNIAERKRAEDELKTLSLSDPLTGLYNRRGFFELAGQQIRVANRLKKRVAMMFADMDDLKGINDRYGHQSGDIAITAAARVLRETYRESDIIARIGGDEFALIPVEVPEAGMQVITGRLEAALEDYNLNSGFSFKISMSVGVAYFDPDKPCSLDELMIRADRAMYEEKRKRHLH